MSAMAKMAGGFAAVVLAVAAVAPAGVLISDPNAYFDGSQTWRGSQQFDNTTFLPDLSVRVEYCVYQPGSFNSSFPGADPTNGGKWIYAYQLFNDITPPPGLQHDYVDQFSIGLNGGNELPSNIGYVAGTGQPPMFSNLIPLTALWYFLSPQITYPGISAVLFYASPFGPEIDNATVQGYNLSYIPNALPSPTPEPTTLILVACGMAVAVRRRKH